MSATSAHLAVPDGVPTNPLGWLVGDCSRFLREGITTLFANAGYGVTPEQWSILIHLRQRDGAPQRALADCFHRNKVSAFALIAKLEERGLLVRSPNPTAARSNLVYLTPEGSRIVDELIPLAEANLVCALEGVAPADLETCKLVACRIIDNMKQARNRNSVSKGPSMADSLAASEWILANPLGWLLAVCSRFLREGLVARFASAGYSVTSEQWGLLAHLYEHDGLPQQALADRFHRSKVAAFHLIAKLEEQGLVIRRPSPIDRRSNLIYLTSEGRSNADKLIPLAQGNLDDALRGVSDADVEVTTAVLRRIRSNMKEARERR